MRTLITGSSGFVAGRLPLPAFSERLNIDLLDGTDVCAHETEHMIREFNPELVFHLAAKHYIPWCETHPDETARTNVIGTAKVLEAALGSALKTFVFASSAAVYGFSADAIDESHPQDGRGIYAWSKQMGESFLYATSKTRPEVRCVAARLFNVVGAGDRHKHVLPSMIEELCGGRVATLGNLWPRRDYVHVADVADALVFLSERAPLGYSTYNVGTGIGTSVRELLTLVADELQVAPDFDDAEEHGSRRHIDGDLVSDPSALRSLGWQASRTLRHAVHEAVVDGRKGTSNER